MEILDYLAKTFGTCAAAVCCLLTVGAAWQMGGHGAFLLAAIGITGLVACSYIAFREM